MFPVAILCGGKGSRIAAIAGDLPKAVLRVAGRPFLEWQLDWLARFGVREVVLCVGYGAAAIRTVAGDGSHWGLRVGYSDDGDTLRGTGGAIARALPYLGETFLTLYGDALLQCDPRIVVDAFRDEDDGVMTVYKNCDRWMRSNVQIEGDRVAAYDKEGRSGAMAYIDYGLNGFRSTSFDAFIDRHVFDLADVHRAAISRRTLHAVVCRERCYEIGSPEGLAETERFIVSAST